MADLQEKMQSIIIGFIFTYVVVKLFTVIFSFRAGNLLVIRATDDEGPLPLPSKAAELSSAVEQSTLVAIDEQTDADGDYEQEGNAHASSSDSEVADDATAVFSPREIDAAINPTASKVGTKDVKVDTMEDKLEEFKNDEGVEDESIEAQYVSIPGERSLKSLMRYFESSPPFQPKCCVGYLKFNTPSCALILKASCWFDVFRVDVVWSFPQRLKRNIFR